MSIFNLVTTEGNGLYGDKPAKKVPAPAFLLTNGESKGRREEAVAGEQEHVESSYSYRGIK